MTARMRNRNRRGQAAMEYLVTYGWGFLVILIVVGAMAYFGFLNPTRYIPARCSFGAQMECADYKLEASIDATNNGVVYLALRNNFGDNINITKVATVSGKSTNNSVQVPVMKGTTSGVVVLQLNPLEPIALIEGERTSVPLYITFRRDTSRFPTSPLHNVSGEVFTTVQ